MTDGREGAHGDGALFHLWVQRDGEWLGRNGQPQTLLRGFDKVLVLDRMLPAVTKRVVGIPVNFNTSNREPQWERVFDLPLADIERIEIEEISGASSSYGWKPTTGFLHGPTNVPAVTGLLVVTRAGEHMLFRVPKMAPIEVRAQVGPVLARIERRNDEGKARP
jgi:hypothetical protein